MGVSIHLQSLSSTSSSGRMIAIREGKPRVFKVMKSGLDAGSVTVEIVDGHCLLNNRSQRPVLVNGAEQNRCALVTGDLVVIGKDTFRVGETPDPERLPDRKRSRERERVAARPETGRPIPPPLVKARSPQPPASPQADEALSVNVSPEASEPLVLGKANSDSDRRRRSISASMPAMVEPPRKTMLDRVSSVFSAKKRSQRSREESLQLERHHLLEEAGRQVLNAQAFGLPEEVFSDLLAGRTVIIRPEEITRTALERWRELTQRLALLDAEIATVRLALGLGPDLGAVRFVPRARIDLKQREESVFAALDALRTQEFGPDPETPTAVPPGISKVTSKPNDKSSSVLTPKPASTSSISGGSRVSGGRRKA